MTLREIARARGLELPGTRARAAVVHLVIIALWFWLYRPLFGYLSAIFSREDFRVNQVLLVGILVMVVARARRGNPALALTAAPRANPLALCLMLCGSLLYLAAERWLDIHILSACLFGLASYGLLGLWLTPQAWRRGLPAALLIVGTLPFGDFMQVFAGYPLRIFTAALVRDGLAALGVASVGVETILVFENSIAQVDIPCSGVKGLWTGALFLIAATWIEGRALNLRWLALAIAFGLVLVCANLARVMTLVVVGQVMGWHLAAEMLHAPLGVLGFALACAFCVVSLRAGATPADSLTMREIAAPLARLPAPLLAALLLALNLAYAPRPTLAPAATRSEPMNIAFPAELYTEFLELRPGELDWLFRDGAEAVERVRFEWRGLTGSLLLVQSRTWRAHHYPQRCFENYGLRVEVEQTHVVNGSLPLRVLTLSNGKPEGRLTASYWFQSAERATDDYGARLWSALSPQPARWVLVTVLFDAAPDARAAETNALYTALYEAVRAHLKQAE